MTEPLIGVGIYEDHNAGVAAIDGGELRVYGEIERRTRTKNQAGWFPEIAEEWLGRVPRERIGAVCAGDVRTVRAFLCERFGARALDDGRVSLGGRPVRLLSQDDLHPQLHFLSTLVLPGVVPDVYAVMVFDAGRPQIGWVDLRAPLRAIPDLHLRSDAATSWYVGDIFAGLFGTMFYGAPSLESCGKLMGMASWGRPTVGAVDGLRELARETFDPTTKTWLGYRTVAPDDVHASVVQRFAVDPLEHDTSETLDLAASAQELFRHQLVAFASAELERIEAELRAHDLPRPRAILYAGGCALSVVTNAALRKATGLAVIAPPFSHDAGQFVGGAFYAALACNESVPLGRGWPGLPNHLAGVVGPREIAGAGAELRPIEPDEVARRILEGELLACVGDGAEAGPRALGNRSLLANALDPSMRERLNDEVKKREWYRPFAPMLPAEAFPEYYGEDATPCARYMLDSFTLRPALRGVLSSVASPDGVSRAQAVERSSSRWLYALLEALGARSGRPVVLNTSLNAPGLPIAFDCRQTLDDARALGLDALVVREPASDGIVPRAYVAELRERACASAS